MLCSGHLHSSWRGQLDDGQGTMEGGASQDDRGSSQRGGVAGRQLDQVPLEFREVLKNYFERVETIER